MADPVTALSGQKVRHGEGHSQVARRGPLADLTGTFLDDLDGGEV